MTLTDWQTRRWGETQLPNRINKLKRENKHIFTMVKRGISSALVLFYVRFKMAENTNYTLYRFEYFQFTLKCVWKSVMHKT